MSDPAERVAILRDRVEEQERELGAAVHELKVAARRVVGPAAWVREKPLLWMSGALALGWWLGHRGRGAGRRRR